MEPIFWVGVLGILGAVSSGISLYLVTTLRHPRELQSSVRQLELDLHELFDTVEKWTRRDRVRRLRESREEQPPAVNNDRPQDRGELKSWLRRKASHGVTQ